jgi:transposase-like protein
VHTKEFATMALSKSALSELLDALRAGGDLDVIREGLALVLQALIDAEATQHIGARPYERSEQRTAHRNGTRSRLLSTKAGDVELRIPSCARGRSSRRCWSRAAASTGPCWRW